MQTGTIVKFMQHPEDPDGPSTYPAIVMGEWADGTVQLYVMQFDHPSHIRAAHPSQVGIMVDPDEIVQLRLAVEHLLGTASSHERRIAVLEGRTMPLQVIGAIGPGVESTQTEPAEVEAEPVGAGGNSGKKRWPK